MASRRKEMEELKKRMQAYTTAGPPKFAGQCKRGIDKVPGTESSKAKKPKTDANPKESNQKAEPGNVQVPGTGAPKAKIPEKDALPKESNQKAEPGNVPGTEVPKAKNPETGALPKKSNQKAEPGNVQVPGTEAPKAKNPKMDAKPKKNADAGISLTALSKIIMHLRSRHMNGHTEGLTLDEICVEAKIYDATLKTRRWLEGDALRNNPKIKVSASGDRYAFKPVLNVRGVEGLQNLLDKQFSEVDCGAISMEHLNESLPNCEKIMRSVQAAVQTLVGADNKSFLFNAFQDVPVSLSGATSTLKGIWNSASTGVNDENNLEKALLKLNLKAHRQSKGDQVQAPRRPVDKAKAAKMNAAMLKQNPHMASTVIFYDDLD